jgi:hypothetical protein
VELVVDLSSGSLVLRHHRDMKRLSVLARHRPPGPDAEGGAGGALDGLAEVLRAHDAGMVEPDGDVFVPEGTLRRLAAIAATEESRSLDPEWESEFAGMLDYAATKGWVAADGSVRVHVEWRS